LKAQFFSALSFRRAAIVRPCLANCLTRRTDTCADLTVEDSRSHAVSRKRPRIVKPRENLRSCCRFRSDAALIAETVEKSLFPVGVVFRAERENVSGEFVVVFHHAGLDW